MLDLEKAEEPEIKLDLEKAEEPEIKLPTSAGSQKIWESVKHCLTLNNDF